MSRLNRGQRIAVLAGLAFVLYVFGHWVISVIFSTGWVVYAPVDSGFNWTVVWQGAVQFAIWVVLAGSWTYIAIRTLRSGSTAVVDADSNGNDS
jgi:hypothetical protein